MTESTYSFNFNIDDVKTRTVERLISPLIHLLTSLHANMQPLDGTSREGNEVLKRLRERLDNFIMTGQQVLQIKLQFTGAEKIFAQLTDALNDASLAGNNLLTIGEPFVADAENPNLRAQTVEASRATLLAIARLLIITDMIDVDIMIKQADKVRQHFNALKNVQSKSELLKTSQNLDMELHELMEMTRRRVRDLRDSAAQDDIQAAIAMLKITAPIMIASSKAFLQHPSLDGLRFNQNYADDELNRALNCFCDAVQGQRSHDDLALSQHGKLNDLALNFEKFQRRVYMDPSEFQSHRHRPQLEELLERIASASGLIADMNTTKPMRRDQIISGVNNLRKALQDLLEEYEQNVGSVEPSEDLDLCKVFLAHKVRDLRRHLRRTIVDHVSDVFVDTRTPLLQLVEYASSGNFPNTERSAELFQTQANNVVSVARLVANISHDVAGVRVLRYATLLCEKISPQVYFLYRWVFN
jgi:ribosomal protein S15P/S13E